VRATRSTSRRCLRAWHREVSKLVRKRGVCRTCSPWLRWPGSSLSGVGEW